MSEQSETKLAPCRGDRRIPRDRPGNRGEARGRRLPTWRLCTRGNEQAAQQTAQAVEALGAAVRTYRCNVGDAEPRRPPSASRSSPTWAP